MRAKSTHDCPECGETLLMTEIGVQEVWLICDACETDYKLIRSHNDPAFPDESKLVKRNKKEVEASNEV